MTEDISLLVTAGNGPAECNLAVGHILTRMVKEAEDLGLTLSVHRTQAEGGPKSAVVVVHGPHPQRFATAWVGTIQWRMQSRLRQNHKRSNWFVGVFELAQSKTLDSPQEQTIQAANIAFSTLRAGGPGGQHQNTTDSAVRALHRPTGLCVVVREARSQHRNKTLALERLRSLAAARATADKEAHKARQNRLHHALERGNPRRRFTGPLFEET